MISISITKLPLVTVLNNVHGLQYKYERCCVKTECFTFFTRKAEETDFTYGNLQEYSLSENCIIALQKQRIHCLILSKFLLGLVSPQGISGHMQGHTDLGGPNAIWVI